MELMLADARDRGATDGTPAVFRFPAPMRKERKAARRAEVDPFQGAFHPTPLRPVCKQRAIPASSAAR